MLRLPDGAPAKLAYKEHLTKAKGSQGRRKQTWIRQINIALKPMNKTVNELTKSDYEKGMGKNSGKANVLN